MSWIAPWRVLVGSILVKGVCVHNMGQNLGDLSLYEYSCLSSQYYTPTMMRSWPLIPSFFCVPIMMSLTCGSHTSHTSARTHSMTR